MKKRVETNLYKDRAIELRLTDIDNIIEDVQLQLDGKIETYYQSADPSADWTEEQKSEHVGDLWYRTTDHTTFRWDGTAWAEQTVPTDVFDEIDGKAQIFVSTPTPPYQVGDVWFNQTTGEILTCVTNRESGSYAIDDWRKLNKYTDDTATEELALVVAESVQGADVEYYNSTSPTTLAGGSWSTVSPQWQAGRYIWTRTRWTQNDGEITYSNPSCITGNTGADGAPATTQYIRAGNSVIHQLKTGALSPTTIIFYAEQRAGTGDPADYYGRFIISESTNGTSWTTKYTSSTDEKQKNYTPSTNTIKYIRCELYRSGGTTVLLDSQTVPVISDGVDGEAGATGAAGKDAYTVVLTNENHTFAAGTSAALSGSARCYVVAYKGKSRIAATIGTITGKPTGMTTSVVNNGTTSPYFMVYVDTTMTTKNGVLNVPVTVDGETFDMQFTYSLALTGATGAQGNTGAKGADGVGITSITELYYCSDSSVAPAAPTSHVTTSSSTSYNVWNRTAPKWTAVYRYYYTCSEILFTDGTYGWSGVVSNNAYQVSNENAYQASNYTHLWGTCSTGAGVASKVVNCPNCTALYSGMRIVIRFSYSNIYASGPITLNVNSLGTKNIMVGGSVVNASNQMLWASNAVIEFTYDGTYFIPEGYEESLSITSDSNASSQDKIALAPRCVIVKGTKVSCRFTNQNAAEAPTLDLIGGAAKSIRAKNATVPANSPFSWKANSSIDFIFDGQYWQMANTNMDDFIGYYDEYLDQAAVFEKFFKKADGTYLEGMYVGEDGEVYINMSYLQSGIIKVGGVNDRNGVLEVYDGNGNLVGHWDKNGLYIGNIAPDDMTDPNTMIASSGTITTKSLIANDYIYVDGTGDSFFKVPTKWYSGENSFVEISNNGFILSATPNCKILSSGFSGVAGTMPQSFSPHACLKFTNSEIGSNHSLDIFAEGIYIINSRGYVDPLVELSMNRFRVRNALTAWVNPTSSTVGVYISNGLSVSGTKSRLVKTQDYGDRLLYCYETPSPMFGDVGEGTISEDGQCRIWLDPTFSETITTTQYQVFLQKYGDGDLWVKERHGAYFVVEGTPSLSFGWELKAKQSDFDQLRLDQYWEDPEKNNTDYGDLAIQHINEINNERKVA